MKEAYASGDEDGIDLVAIVLNHATFPSPVYLVGGSDDDLALPISDGGATVLHTAVSFSYTPPGFDTDGPTDGKLSVDNVSGYLNSYLELATGQNRSISVTMRRYHVSASSYALPTSIDEEITGLVIRSVSLTASRAEASLTYPDVREDNFPLAIYTAEEYPALSTL